MRAVIQRVTEASVSIGGSVKSAIGPGLLVLLGIGHDDDRTDIAWLSGKIAGLRIFDDDNGVMNRSVVDVGGEVLVVSQFTLMASTKKGNRPAYIKAAGHEIAIPLYEAFCAALSDAIGRPVQTGTFGADMQVALVNDGPVTICIDTKDRQ
ncbi:MAG: D-tyrosyl-tRNA(Tyr) deacylase [Bacteroidales bacterium]|nr:D-tyrosyl-tRNA(Tyr) deacylase [Bacteroidales bacterium]